MAKSKKKRLRQRKKQQNINEKNIPPKTAPAVNVQKPSSCLRCFQWICTWVESAKYSITSRKYRLGWGDSWVALIIRKIMVTLLWTFTFLFMILFIWVIFFSEGELQDKMKDMSMDRVWIEFEAMQNKIQKQLYEDVPGKELFKRGVRAKHPLILIPGIITSHLEVWQSAFDQCNFPARFVLWGMPTNFKDMLLNWECWSKHMKLNLETGLDPSNIKVRAREGFESGAFTLGFWVWDQIIKNFAAIGYTSNNMKYMPYDWRLAFGNLEVRDKYFSRLKFQIEHFVQINDEKVVVVMHSMGSQVFFYFMGWVQHPDYGNGGKDWIAKHIKTISNVAGTTFGSKKSASAMISGESLQTVGLDAPFSYVTDTLMPQTKEFGEIFRSWGSPPFLFPIGGEQLWNEVYNKIQPMMNEPFIKNVDGADYSHDNWIEFLREIDPEYVEKWVDPLEMGFTPPDANISSDEFDSPRYWHNPFFHVLPNAPDLTIQCLYGYEPTMIAEDRFVYSSFLGKKHIDTSWNKNGFNKGIGLTPGDNSVTIVSLGLGCAKLWKSSRFNPHGVKVTNREYLTEPAQFGIIRSQYSGDHLDLLGNVDLLTDLLLTVSGEKEKLEDRFHSPILYWLEDVNVEGS